METKRKKTILVADDNEGIVASLTMALQYGGYKVVSTTNGERVRKIRSPLPSLILLDIRMAETDGLELCKYLKERSDTKYIPIVMISAQLNSYDFAMAAGANDFIEKPYTLDEVLSTVEKYLKE